MTIVTPSWERLLALACGPSPYDEPFAPVAADTQTLAGAYAQCAELTRQHSKTFYMASGLLPPAKRRAMRALYAFCRISDDMVDRADGDALAQLDAWRQRAQAAEPPRNDSIALAWADTRARYGIPARYAHQLIDGVARDIHITRYTTFDELAEYAYGVASTVGLMSMYIVGFSGLQAVPYAIKLGVALQLTNILRDVQEDWQTGRCYLPQDELAIFGLTEENVAAGRVSERWRTFMRFQIERTRRIYVEAMPGLALLHSDGRFAVAAAAELYRAILTDIEAHDYDVFSRRAFVSRWGKLRRLPGIWWRARWSRYKGADPPHHLEGCPEA